MSNPLLLAFYAVIDLIDCPQSTRTYLHEVGDALTHLKERNTELTDELNYLKTDIEWVRKDRDSALTRVYNLEAKLYDLKALQPLQASDAELQTALGGQKIQAIKAHRERTGLGLLDSKNAIEDAMQLATGSTATPTPQPVS